MRLISIGAAARTLGVDPDTMRRRLFSDALNREYVELDGLRLRVYRKGAHANRYFDATEIAYQLVQRAKRRRLGEK